MDKVKFKDLKLPKDFVEEYGKFRYLHLDYEGIDGWFILLTNKVFYQHWQDVDLDNWYEIGLCDVREDDYLNNLLGLKAYQRFYEVEYEEG